MNVAGTEDVQFEGVEARERQRTLFPEGRVLLTVVGFGCFLTLQTYYGLSFALPLSFDYTIDFSIILRIISILATLVLLMVCLKCADWILQHCQQALVALSCCSVVPFLAEIGTSLAGATVIPLTYVTWALLGVGYAASALLWCLILSQNSLRQNAITLGASAFLSVFFYFSTSAIQPVILSLTGTAIVLTTGIVVASYLLKRAKTFSVDISCEERIPALTIEERLWVVCANAVYGFMLIMAGVQGLFAVLIIGACGLFGALLSIVSRFLPVNRMPSSRQIQQGL